MVNEVSSKAIGTNSEGISKEALTKKNLMKSIAKNIFKNTGPLADKALKIQNLLSAIDKGDDAKTKKLAEELGLSQDTIDNIKSKLGKSDNVKSASNTQKTQTAPKEKLDSFNSWNLNIQTLTWGDSETATYFDEATKRTNEETERLKEKEEELKEEKALAFQEEQQEINEEHSDKKVREKTFALTEENTKLWLKSLRTSANVDTVGEMALNNQRIIPTERKVDEIGRRGIEIVNPQDLIKKAEMAKLDAEREATLSQQSPESHSV